MIEHNEFDITNYNSYKISSKVKKALFPENLKEVETLSAEINDMIILGGGNNIIISKSYYDKTFLFLRENLSAHTVKGNVIETEAGYDMAELSGFAYNNALSGLEIFLDIPGTVGGAIYMNAGNAEICIGELVDKVWALNKDAGIIEQFSQEECAFGYRKSIFQQRGELVILKVSLSLKTGRPEMILEKMRLNKLTRESKQPKEFPNAGSVFKRPNGHYVGTMIESLGLKGYSVGGAQVSEKHAGFIVNKGEAKGEDIVQLIKIVQQKVYDAYAVKLELEQVII